MKSIKRLITLVLSSTLVLIPMMVSAKVPVSNVGGIVLIGNKGYSMNYLMQTLNETQITEIRQDLNSPSATHLYFKLSDNNAKWIDAFDSSITVDDTALEKEVGNDITVVDVSGRNSVKIIDTVDTNAILPEAITFNSDGTTNDITTNDYVNKAYPGKGYGNYNAILNPDYDKNLGAKHQDGCDHITPCFIDNNILNFAYTATDKPKTFSEGLTYNKYMQDEIRELMKSYIGTTQYDKVHYIDMSEMNEQDGIHDELIADYESISNNSNKNDFIYLFPLKPLLSMKEIPDGYSKYIFYDVYTHIKDNASVVLDLSDYNTFNNAETVNMLKQSLCAVFGKNYYEKIYDYMISENTKRHDSTIGQQTNKWDGNDSVTIGNITIYVSYYGKFYSFFLK